MTGFHEDCIEVFRRIAGREILDHFGLKYVEGDDAAMGELRGVQIDSTRGGGYMYFWSSGYVAFQFMDYRSDEEIIEDTTIRADMSTARDVIERYIATLGRWAH